MISPCRYRKDFARIFFSGLIDDVRIYRRALSAEEIERFARSYNLEKANAQNDQGLAA